MKRIRNAFAIACLSVVALVGFATQAQASVTVVHDTGQVTINNSTGSLKYITLGFDVTSLKYPSGSNIAYKPRSVRINNTYNEANWNTLACNGWYGNDNAPDYADALDNDAEQTPSSWTNTNCNNWFGVGKFGQYTSTLYTSNDDGTNVSCVGSGWVVCPVTASAGPGGSVNDHPDMNFGVEMSVGVSAWECYVGIRLALGGGANQNVNYNCSP